MQAEEEARAGAPTLGALPIVALHMREVTKKRDLMAFDNGPDPTVQGARIENVGKSQSCMVY